MTGEPETPQPLKLQQAHLSRYRARLRAEAEVLRDDLIALADRIAAVEGITRVLARPATGSLILETAAEAADVLASLKDLGLVRIAAPGKPPPVDQVLQLGLARMDFGIRDKTDNELDLRTAMALALIAGAIVQMARGRYAGPATTLLMSAFSLLDRSTRK
ncbi:MAG: hypothetical protein R3D85_01885 [Paracoccaceae bacterium]